MNSKIIDLKPHLFEKVIKTPTPCSPTSSKEKWNMILNVVLIKNREFTIMRRKVLDRKKNRKMKDQIGDFWQLFKNVVSALEVL